PSSPPPLAEKVALYQREHTAASLAEFRTKGANNPMLRGYALRNWGDWWPLFFYRFVDPEQRMGGNLNYAQRIQSARAEVRPTGWVIYYCPPLTIAGSSIE